MEQEHRNSGVALLSSNNNKLSELPTKGFSAFTSKKACAKV
jgi:hypothetical protein